MSYDFLSTSSITKLINNYKSYEVQKRVAPLNTRKSKYETLNTAWSDLKSKLSSLQTITDKLVDSSGSTFGAKTASISDETYLGVSASSSAVVNSYNLRVNQLAKSDVLLTDTLSSTGTIALADTTQSFSIQVGSHTSTVDVTFDATETYESYMQKIADAVNNDTASATSAALNGNSKFSGSGSFDIDLNGTTHTINYNYAANTNWSTVMSELASQISAVDGLTAETTTNGSDVQLKIAADDPEHYMTINSADPILDASNLDINIVEERSISDYVSASAFSPSSGNTKLSFTSKEAGYDNRLALTETSGDNILTNIGLDSTTLSSRTIAPDNNIAGYLYTANSGTDNKLDAILNFNGIDIYRSSNSISDLVEGVTFSLKAAQDATDPDVSVTIEQDTSSMKSQIEDFISKFNEAYSYIRGKYYSDKVLGRGVFMGDRSASSLLGDMRQVAGSVSGLPDGEIAYLGQIGLAFDPEAGLSISNSSQLDEALEDTPDQVAALFNSTDGIAVNLAASLGNYTKVGGVIDNLTDTYSNNINYLKDKIETLNSRIDNSAEVLRGKYEQLQQQLVDILNAQQMFANVSNGMFM